METKTKFESVSTPQYITYDGRKYAFYPPITVAEFINQLKIKKKDKLNFMAGVLNNKLVELPTQIYGDCTLSLVSLGSLDGIKIYQRSCLFLLLKAFKSLYPNLHLKVLHSLQEGIYCNAYPQIITKEMVERTFQEMKRLVKMDLPIDKKLLPLQNCRNLLLEQGHQNKYKLLKYKQSSFSKLHYMEDFVGYFLGYLAPSTKYLRKFNLKMLKNGMVLVLPTIISPNKVSKKLKPIGKFHKILTEFQNWSKILGVETVGQLNQVIENGEIGDIMKISEGLHEKKIAYIADRIARGVTRKDSTKKIKLVLISGPSSSGKTTFTKRLDIQLRVNGIRTVIIGLDNYYVNRDQIPLDKNGEMDFEQIHALNVDLFNQHLSQLFNGEEVQLPKYDFSSGTSSITGKKLKLEDEQVVIVEGIHGLNPLMTAKIPDANKYKIYVSALTQIRYDSTNLIPTTDIRLLRRIVRDNKYRSYSANQTIQRWPSVRVGEESHIFPFQENADVMFNSALSYEIPILKLYAEPLLRQVPETSEVFLEVHRLLKFLSYFIPISADDVPYTSILREFIGKSSFSY